MDSKEAKRATWKHRIEEWQASGKSCKRWAKENKFPYQTVLYWKDKLSKENDLSTISFVELKDSPKNFPIELIVSDVTIRIHPGFDPSSLKMCLQLLRTH